MNCPHCGKEIEPQQKRAAQSRWSSMTEKARSEEMSRIRRKGIRLSKKKVSAPKNQGEEIKEKDEA